MPKDDAVDPSDMAQAFLECHADHHWWKYQGVSDILQAGKGKRVQEFTRDYLCMRCGETKKVRRSRDFSLAKQPAYKQPEGYTIKRDGSTKGVHHSYVALQELMEREGFLF